MLDSIYRASHLCAVSIAPQSACAYGQRLVASTVADVYHLSCRAGVYHWAYAFKLCHGMAGQYSDSSSTSRALWTCGTYAWTSWTAGSCGTCETSVTRGSALSSWTCEVAGRASRACDLAGSACWTCVACGTRHRAVSSCWASGTRVTCGTDRTSHCAVCASRTCIASGTRVTCGTCGTGHCAISTRGS